MTLNQLIQKAQSLSYQLSSGDISMYSALNMEIQDIDFKIITDEGDSYIRMIVY